MWTRVCASSKRAITCHHSRRRRLNRLGKTQLVRQVISAEVMTPAAGQGALGIEIRNGDTATRSLLAFLDGRGARATTTCERALLNKLGGGCQVPIGAFAEAVGGRIRLNVRSPSRWNQGSARNPRGR